MDNEVKEMIDLYIKEYYYEGFHFGEDNKETIYKVFENEALDGYFTDINEYHKDILDKYAKEDFDEIFKYYIEKLCEYCNLNYRLANNRFDYIVYPK